MFKVGDTVLYKGVRVKIVACDAVNDIYALNISAQRVDVPNTMTAVKGRCLTLAPELSAHADNADLIRRAYAAYTRAIIKDTRAVELAAAHRYEDAADFRVIHAAAMHDFYQAFKALEAAMPDVWDVLKGGK